MPIKYKTSDGPFACEMDGHAIYITANAGLERIADILVDRGPMPRSRAMANANLLASSHCLKDVLFDIVEATAGNDTAGLADALLRANFVLAKLDGRRLARVLHTPARKSP